MLFHIAKAVFLELATKPAVNVLHDAQRTNHAAIDSAKDQGNGDDDGGYHKRHGEQGWNELDFGDPSCPLVNAMAKFVADAVAYTHKKQGDQQDHDDGEGDADFTEHGRGELKGER